MMKIILYVKKVFFLIKKLYQLFWKCLNNCRRYGVKDTIKKVCYRILHRNQKSEYERWLLKHTLTKDDLIKQRHVDFEISPLISIVVPLYKTPKTYLGELIDSVKNQTYSNWELCLSDGSGENSPIQTVLRKYKKLDKRIKVIYTGEQYQISENTNKAMDLVTGDYIAFADHDDLLAPDALYECVKAINTNPEIKVIYTDEDKISMDGKVRFQPHFKPDYNKDLLNSTNYFCHLFVVKRDIAEKVGGLDSAYDGAQDYDFVLRCTEITEAIHHIPKVLYHWRAHLDSTAENPESKMYAFEAGKRAIQAHYDRIGWTNTEVTQTECLGVYRTHYKIEKEPLVSIIIPNKDHISDLKKCLASIKRAKYRNYEIIIIENNSTEKRTFEYYDRLKKVPRIKILTWEDEFNYSAINNFGVMHAEGEYLLFLNNDTEIINSDCIHELVGFCERKDVGIVGARLYYKDNTIQHAGVVVGLGGIAGHIFLNTPGDQVGYFARIITQQDCSAVTGACLMIKKKAFQIVDGFDTNLKVAYNDVDLCLKVRNAGYLIVYNPYAELYHYESKSRGNEDTPDKKARLQKESNYFSRRWRAQYGSGDPYYNINFTTDRFDCSGFR